MLSLYMLSAPLSSTTHRLKPTTTSIYKMFINKNLIAGAFMALVAVASAGASSLKIVDVTSRLADSVEDATIVTLKAGGLYDVSTAPDSGDLYVQCPTTKKGTSKKATVSYISASYSEGNSFYVYDQDGNDVCYLAGYDYESTYAYSLATVVCANGLIHSVSYSY